jgi:hypothetical protein
MSSRFFIDEERAEDPKEVGDLEQQQRRKRSNLSQKQSNPSNESGNNESPIRTLMIGLVIGCAVYLSSNIIVRHLKAQQHVGIMRERFQASKDAWKNFQVREEAVVESEVGQKHDQSQEDFPRIVWQGWKSTDTSKFDNFRNKMIEENPDWKFKLVTNEEQEKFLRETDDEIVHLAYRSFKLINPKNGASRADVWRYAVMYYHGGFYLDMDSSCADFNKLLEVANANHANVLLSREGGKVNYIHNRHKTVMWAFLAKPGHPLLANAIKTVWDNMKFDQPREEIMVRGGSNSNDGDKMLTLEFSGTIAFSRAVEMTRITGQGDDTYIYGQDFEGLCNFKAPGLKGDYYEKGEGYDDIVDDVYRIKLPDDDV